MSSFYINSDDKVEIIIYAIVFGGVIVYSLAGLLLRIFHKKRGTTLNVLKHWADGHGLKFQAAGNQLKHIDRLTANKGKHFFNAEKVMNWQDDSIFIEGVIKDRKIWIYEIVGKPSFGSGMGTVRSVLLPDDAALNAGESRKSKIEKIFYGWCIEVGTHSVPQKVLVTRKFIAGQDTHDTESHSFEDEYNVSSEEKNILQLLDPVMMDLIHRSKVAAVEISDASVVLYYTLPRIDYEILDSLLEYGIKIAIQVDRNFPLG